MPACLPKEANDLDEFFVALPSTTPPSSSSSNGDRKYRKAQLLEAPTQAGSYFGKGCSKPPSIPRSPRSSCSPSSPFSTHTHTLSHHRSEEGEERKGNVHARARASQRSEEEGLLLGRRRRREASSWRDADEGGSSSPPPLPFWLVASVRSLKRRKNRWSRFARA